MARDSLVSQYQVVWNKVIYFYESFLQNNTIMSVAFFEANFKKQFETLFLLADQIKQYYNIFDGYSDAIAQAVHLVNTADILDDKDKNSFKELQSEKCMTMFVARECK